MPDGGGPAAEASARERIFVGGGEMGAIMRALDWSQTALGPVEAWSPALRMMARFLLANRFPLLLWWGPQFCQLYNDAYRPILGTKHPQFVGRPVSECWDEIWHILEPLIRTPFEGGPPTWMEDILLEINRYGFVEETHFTIAYSPVPDELAPGGIGGVLATVHEISEKVVGDRRTQLLRDLGGGMGETAEEACARAAKILSGYPKDIPFALLHLIDSGGKTARLSGAAGVEVEESNNLELITLESSKNEAVWPLFEILKTEAPQLVEDLGTRFKTVPAGPWQDPPKTALILPIKSNVAHHLAGFLIAGISPRLRLNDSYRGFLELVSSQIATAIANARAYEEERKRAEALAEIDRAKTTFFTNISHEFRTPLTLLLSPLEETLSKANAALGDPERAQLAVAHRNGLRLLKLVNTLLDFSRIEAGRIQANYQPTDLARLTRELAGMFQSAVDKAGLYLRLECDPLDQAVYVDRDMWEKVLLNLLSNAFKFTFEGGIEVSLKEKDNRVELAITDTGTGIPEAELPRLFERFHRVEGARGRTFEGSGIGLALVQELVKIHGGQISVASVFGQGSTFTVSIPKRKAHLPQDRAHPAHDRGSKALGADGYLAEALRWIPEAPGPTREPPIVPEIGSDLEERLDDSFDSQVKGSSILLADDNADMREYVRRLLAPHYQIQAVSNGEDALRVIKERCPDLVLTDVMMPVVDGFGLLSAIRSDSSTSTIPVIMLSARAGEESRVEGLQSGATDYLIKPFTARELLARVASQLAISKLRKQLTERERDLREKAEAARAALQVSEQKFRTIVTATSDVVYRMNADWSEMRQLQGKDFIADTEDSSRTWIERYIHPEDRAHVVERISAAIRNKTIFQLEHRVRKIDGAYRWTFSRAVPILDENQEIVEWLGAASDVTDRKQAEELLRRSAQQLSLITDSAPVYIAHCDSLGRFKFVNRGYAERFGLRPAECIGKHLSEIVGAEAYESIRRYIERALRGELVEYEAEVPYSMIGKHFVHCSYAPEFGPSGNVTGFVAAITDITTRKRMEDALRKSEKLAAVGRLAATIAHEINNPLEAVTNIIWLLQCDKSLPQQARDYLKTADEELSRVGYLTKQTLGFSRENASPQRLRLKELLEGVLAIFGPRLRNKGIKVHKEIDPGCEVTGVQTDLRQIITNLVSNSIDAVPLGGEVRIRVSPFGKAAMKGARITIADNGYGIPESNRKRIFEPFFSTKADVGTGLGLWIASEAIRKHKGSIRLKSSTKSGQSWTVFSIFLPDEAGSQERPALSSPEALQPAS